MSEGLSIGRFNRLKTLFESKHWDIDDSLEISTFSRFCKTLESLTEPQQDMLLKISEKFLHIGQKDYLESLIEPLSCLRKATEGEMLFFTCCLPQEDIGKCKSSMTVLYLLKGSTIKTRIGLDPYKTVECFKEETIKYLPKNEKFRIILVDDFIGSGETAVAAAEYIKRLAGDKIQNNQIMILSIVAMQRGVEALDGKGYRVFSKYICKRGISDSYDDPLKSEFATQMQEIENGIKKLEDKFRFGYQGSEALVCMERCPNNTFPIYWRTKGVAPYER